MEDLDEILLGLAIKYYEPGSGHRSWDYHKGRQYTVRQAKTKLLAWSKSREFLVIEEYKKGLEDDSKT